MRLSLRVVRLRSRTASVRSSRVTCLLAADRDMPRRRAAVEKLLVSTTLAKTSISSGSSTLVIHLIVLRNNHVLLFRLAAERHLATLVLS